MINSVSSSTPTPAAPPSFKARSGSLGFGTYKPSYTDDVYGYGASKSGNKIKKGNRAGCLFWVLALPMLLGAWGGVRLYQYHEVKKSLVENKIKTEEEVNNMNFEELKAQKNSMDWGHRFEIISDTNDNFQKKLLGFGE